jgi:McbB family protein
MLADGVGPVKYQLQPFQLRSLATGEALVYSIRGTSRVSHCAVIELLRRLSRFTRGQLLDRAWFLAHVANGDAADPILEYLAKELLVVRETPDASWRLRRIALSADDPEARSILLEELELATGIECVDAAEHRGGSGDEMVVVFQQNYQPRSIEDLYRREDAFGTTILYGYVNGRSFIVDNPFVNGAYVACHFCSVGRSGGMTPAGSNEERGPCSVGDIAGCDEASLLSEVQLTRLDRLAACHFLKLRIVELAGPRPEPMYCDAFMSQVRFDLDTGRRVENPCYLWEGCSCLKRSFVSCDARA